VVKEKQTVEDRFEKEYMALKQDRDDKVTQLRGSLMLNFFYNVALDANMRLLKLVGIHVKPDILTFSQDCKKDVCGEQTWFNLCILE
jgi:hypothetical protein